jgi:hypothetical protein
MRPRDAKGGWWADPTGDTAIGSVTGFQCPRATNSAPVRYDKAFNMSAVIRVMPLSVR